MKADNICFNSNTDGDRFGHCGIDVRKKEIPCEKK